jgi:hypothetical protein
VDVFHHHLETIKATGLWNLNLSYESVSKIFKNNSVRSSEESEYHFDEVLLFLLELVPIFFILSQVDLFGCPEAGHLVFVHLPNIVVLDWKDYKSIWVLFQKWLW